MSYFTRTDIEAEIPLADLVALLDDDHDGSEDTGLYTALAARAEARVNAILQRRHSLPFATVPLAVAEAAILSLCAALYRRRGTKDAENPFAAREDKALASLSLSAGANRIAEEEPSWSLDNQEGLC